MPVSFINGPIQAVDFEQITGITNGASVTLTASKVTSVNEPIARSNGQDVSYVDVKKMDEIMLTVETAPIRYRIDGTAPTTAVGHLLNAGDSVVITGYTNLKNLKMIATTATNALVNVTYFRR